MKGLEPRPPKSQTNATRPLSPCYWRCGDEVGNHCGIMLCSLFSCCTRFILVFRSDIARSVVFIIPRLLLYFALDSCTKLNFQIVIFRR